MISSISPHILYPSVISFLCPLLLTWRELDSLSVLSQETLNAVSLPYLIKHGQPQSRNFAMIQHEAAMDTCKWMLEIARE
jgi:hypothetical protein